jgi:hypothetical protein
MRNLARWIGFIVWLSAYAAAQTTAANLHNRYAEPNREEMEARPGVSIIVQYGLDRQACEIRIQSNSRSLFFEEPEAPMRPEVVTEIIDEIVPLDERGKPGMPMIVFAGCNTLSIQEYEFVTITRSSHECLPLQAARENPAQLIFKKPECSEMQKALSHPVPYSR